MLVLTLQYIDCYFFCVLTLYVQHLSHFVMAAHDSHLQRHKDALHFWSVAQIAVKRTCHACSVSADFIHTFLLHSMLQHKCTSDAIIQNESVVGTALYFLSRHALDNPNKMSTRITRTPEENETSKHRLPYEQACLMMKVVHRLRLKLGLPKMLC